MADLLQQLEKEHREVEALLEKLEETHEPNERKELLATVERALIQHMRTEEEVVYPVLAELDGEKAEEAEAEHDGARELLRKLRAGGVDRPGFGAVVAALTGAIGHHVEEEEGQLFPKLRKEADPARFEVDATAAGRDVEGMTRDELYQAAAELGIEGRSSMNKGELAKAVTASGSRS